MITLEVFYCIGESKMIEDYEEKRKEMAGNLVLNMSGGLLPKNLMKDEVKLLEGVYGKDWFEDLGYDEVNYIKPVF